MKKGKYITMVYNIGRDADKISYLINNWSNEQDEKIKMVEEIGNFSKQYTEYGLANTILSYMEGENKIAVVCEGTGQVHSMKKFLEDSFKNVRDDVHFYSANNRYKTFEKNIQEFKSQGSEGIHVLIFAGDEIELNEVRCFIFIRNVNEDVDFDSQVDKVSELTNCDEPIIFDFANRIKRAELCLDIKKNSKIMKKIKFDLFDESYYIVEKFNQIKSKELKQWDIRYEELKKFKEEHGHINVGYDNKQLSDWIMNQKTGLHLTDEKRYKLDQIGFIWCFKENLWMTRYEELKEYKNKNGSFKGLKSTNLSLSHWLVAQKNNYLKGKLREDRKEKLDAVGVDWRHKSDIVEDKWNRKLNELIEYKNKHGHTNVGQKEGEGTLACWVQTQRRSKKQGRLVASREDKLNEIGFEWTIKNKK